jgi:hypothetical protein
MIGFVAAVTKRLVRASSTLGFALVDEGGFT